MHVQCTTALPGKSLRSREKGSFGNPVDENPPNLILGNKLPVYYTYRDAT